MKYSLKKRIKKPALVELFMMLSDSMDENIPDIVWEGAEFEVDITQENLVCDIGYISAKKGGEFSIKISWITEAAKKAKEKAATEKTKERLSGKTKAEALAAAKKKTPASKTNKPVEIVKDEELWAEEETWTASDDDDDWDNEDYDEEW